MTNSKTPQFSPCSTVRTIIMAQSDETLTRVGAVPAEACGLRLCKIFPGEDLRLCETVVFPKGAAAVDTVLRRAAISGGRVEVDPKGPLPDHFADIFDANHDMIGNVALDARSFRALKNHWMRCKYEATHD